MISRYEATLNGVDMSSLDDRLLILDIGYPTPTVQTNLLQVADLDGYDVGSEYLQMQQVTVTFELHIYDIVERNKACQKVKQWAKNGGVLRTNDREDQFLQVRCEESPSLESVRDWTTPLTVTFATVGIAYWQSDEVKTITLSGKSARGTLKMDGDAPKPALVSIEATAEGNVSSFQAVVGSTVLKLTTLSVTSGQKIVIDYVNGRYLRIRANGVSVMNKLLGDSSDSLCAACGANTSVSITASNKVTSVVTARGLWM